MFSIDQNCHPLWDVVPKLHALSARGHRVTHFIEDLDAAFSAIGSGVEGSAPCLKRERFYRSGGADWGAALFYSEFLGRLPVEIRHWEPFTGMKTSVLARGLGRSVDDLYDEFSPSDNWQLVGPSYVGDRDHHRLVGDLSVAETADFLRQLLAKARADMLGCFVEPAARGRLTAWLDREVSRLDALLGRHADGSLVGLYRDWMSTWVGDCRTVRLDLSSSLFALGSEPAQTALLEAFVRDYDTAAGLYNEAVAESGTGLRPLQTSAGELPFFAALDHGGRAVRTVARLVGGELHVGERSFAAAGGRLPVEALRDAGIRCLTGKAALLVIQARVGESGEELALPYRGSLYMPAAELLVQKLASHHLMPTPLRPIVRVRLHLLDRMRSLETIVRLPAHLARAFGRDQIPARVLGENYAALARQAAERLESFRTEAGRREWREQNCGEALATIDELDARRRELAKTDPKSPEIREVWKRIKALKVEVLSATVGRIADDWHVRDVDYWDSRGATLPWCIALGGPQFYDTVIQAAEICTEPPAPGTSP